MQKDSRKAVKCYTPTIKTDKYAFNHTLTGVEMAFTVKTVEQSAFCGCSKLENIVFSEKLKSIGSFAFLNCSSLKAVALPDSVKIMGEAVFRDCKSLTAVKLPDGLKILPESTFQNCVSLKKVILPKSLEVIDEEAFSGCVNLEEIVFPETLTTIKDKAFKRCFKLKSVSFPKRLRYIGDRAFEHCRALYSVNFNGNLDYIGAAVFPETPCTTPTLTGDMLCTSFLLESSYPLCPTVMIPKGIRSLALGFESTLDFKRRNAEKTCYAHILQLEKYNVKVYISERFYSYNNRADKLIENGAFDFNKYDSQIDSAEEYEKPVIASYRLAYPQELTEKTKSIYEKILTEKAEAAALFATEKNEPEVLEYIVESSPLSNEFCTELYEKASKNKFSKLLQILSQKKQKTEFSEIEAFFDEIG